MANSIAHVESERAGCLGQDREVVCEPARIRVVPEHQDIFRSQLRRDLECRFEFVKVHGRLDPVAEDVQHREARGRQGNPDVADERLVADNGLKRLIRRAREPQSKAVVSGRSGGLDYVEGPA